MSRSIGAAFRARGARWIAVACLGLAAGAAAEPCTRAAAQAGWRAPAVRSGDTGLDFETLISVLAESRVVFVGETHDRLDHHLNQLEIVCRLHRRHPDLAIGMEFFQQPFQGALDEYVAGDLGEIEMLRTTEYFERWRFDYRLYEPILDFARANRIPLVALNLAAEITRKVGRGGIESLDAAERERIPRRIDRSDEGYRERLRRVFEQHPQSRDTEFEHFLEVQLLWDEGMAERAARFLEAHPGRRLVVLAGSGHAVRSGVPSRLARRLDVGMAVVLHEGSGSFSPAEADFVLVSREIELPAPGRLGVLLETTGDTVRVQDFGESSAAREAGIEQGDRIVAIDGRPTRDFTDVKLALRGKRPGETVVLRVEPSGAAQARTVEVTLR